MNGDREEAKSAANSIATENDEHERERNEANQHVATYVTDQLERIRSHESVAVYEDEFEAQLDGL